MADHSSKLTGAQQAAYSRTDNPLIRPVDRAEARTYRILVTLFLLVLPFAVVVGTMVASQQANIADETAATASVVQATTTEDTPLPTSAGGEFATPVGATVLAPAQWTLRGVTHTGTVPVAAQQPAGTVTSITVDGDGHRIAPPADSVDVVVVSVFVAIAVAGFAGVALVTVRAATSHRYDRRRDEDWDDALVRLLA